MHGFSQRLPIVALVVLLGCGDQRTGFHKTITGVEVIVSADVPYRLDESFDIFVRASKRYMDYRLLIGEGELDYTTGELRIGDRGFGSLGEGPVKIEIRRDGVFVNGELRGTLELPGD